MIRAIFGMKAVTIASLVAIVMSCQVVTSEDDRKVATKTQIANCLAKSKVSLSICGIKQVEQLPRCRFDNCYEAIEQVGDGGAKYFCSVYQQQPKWIKIDTNAACLGTDLTIIPIEIETTDKVIVKDPNPSPPPKDDEDDKDDKDDEDDKDDKDDSETPTPPANDNDEADDDDDDANPPADSSESPDNSSASQNPIDKILEELFGGILTP